MTQIGYDPEAKILSIRFQRDKSTDSEIKGNVVLDYNDQGELVNLDIMDVNLEDLLKQSSKKAIQKGA